MLGPTSLMPRTPTYWEGGFATFLDLYSKPDLLPRPMLTLLPSTILFYLTTLHSRIKSTPGGWIFVSRLGITEAWVIPVVLIYTTEEREEFRVLYLNNEGMHDATLNGGVTPIFSLLLAEETPATTLSAPFLSARP